MDERSDRGRGARLVVREREPRDLEPVAALATEVQASDGYPGRLTRDLRTFLVADDALGAWVAELDGRLVGHVALHAASLPVVMERAKQALGAASDDELAVVARLLVDPRTRRVGAGRALLDRAATAAHDLHRHPILDVVTRYEAANALYVAAGWTNAGEVEMRFTDGVVLASNVYVAPTRRLAASAGTAGES